MLPSGNDAAFALAQHFGRKLYKTKYKRIKNEVKSYQFDYHPYYAKYFMREMNDVAQKLDLNLTHFDSPHGLQNIENLSCAADMAKLSATCIKNEYYKSIVNTSFYECKAKQKIVKISSKKEIDSPLVPGNYDSFIKHIKDSEGSFVERCYKWENTNFMLG